MQPPLPSAKVVSKVLSQNSSNITFLKNVVLLPQSFRRQLVKRCYVENLMLKAKFSYAPCESASRPLMGFGELNDNMIKGLMILLKLS